MTKKQFTKYGKVKNIIYVIYNVLRTYKHINFIAVIRGNGYRTLSECTLEQQKQIQHHDTHDIGGHLTRNN